MTLNSNPQRHCTSIRLSNQRNRKNVQILGIWRILPPGLEPALHFTLASICPKSHGQTKIIPDSADFSNLFERIPSPSCSIKVRRTFHPKNRTSILSSASTDIPADDLFLIARINQGDDDAFAILYQRHREWVFRMACRICGCEHMAQDVMQEVFRYFLGKFPGFELRCQLRTFLYPAIRNLSLNALRGSRRYVGGDPAAAVIDQLAAPEHSPSGQDDLLQIIAGLSADHREILLLRFVDGMTLPEISELISIPLGTAKSRLHHALAALRAYPNLQNPSARVNDSPTPSA